VKSGGPPCHCGKRGCLETIIGDAALLGLAGRDVPPNDENVAALFADASRGDRVALAAVRAAASWLGQALGNVVNTLNPQRVILGGSLAGVLEIARPEIEDALDQYAFDPGHPVELTLPRFGDDSALLGAAELAFTDLLEDPLSGQALVR
jgi:predicted NBD/HSP70 family sugar kinase